MCPEGYEVITHFSYLILIGIFNNQHIQWINIQFRS